VVDLVRLRHRRQLDVTAGTLRLPAGISVVLSPSDFMSCLPTEFRDEHNAAYTKAENALQRAEQVDSRLRALEERFETEGSEPERLKELEEEFDRLASVLRSSHNLAFHRREITHDE
jgi:hypothetical protein